MVDEDQIEEKKVTLFESRYILFFIRASMTEEERQERNLNAEKVPSAETEAYGRIGFIFFDISML